jgi:hypothetical protein
MEAKIQILLQQLGGRSRYQISQYQKKYLRGLLVLSGYMNLYGYLWGKYEYPQFVTMK